MDNLTHTLVGMALAETAVGARAASAGEPTRLVPPSWRRAAFVVSVAANNFPDLDLFLSSLTAGKLGYLLHHRGHTHTLIFVPLMAALVLGAVALRARRRAHLWTRTDWWWLTGLALLGCCVHMGLDGLNSYGVHPFWPFDKRWFYGDSVFVLEPWLWALLAATLSGVFRSTGMRVFARVLAVFAVALVWLSGMVPLPMSVLVTASTAVVWLVARRLTPPGRAPMALSVLLVFIAMFALTGARVRQAVTALMAERFPHSLTTDLSLSPLPANLLCWRVLAMAAEGDDYVARDGIYALVPAWVPTAGCVDLGDGRTAPLQPLAPLVDAGSTQASLTWSGEYRMPLARLRAGAQHCDVAAFLRFARAPFELGSPDGDLWGDLRFDREPEASFAEMYLGPVARGDKGCPQRVPSWEPPLQPLLQP